MKSVIFALLSLLLVAARAEEETTTLKLNDAATSTQPSSTDVTSKASEKVPEGVSSPSPSSIGDIATTLKVVVLNGPASTPVKPFFLNDGPGAPVPGLEPNQAPKDLPVTTSESPKEVTQSSEELSTSKITEKDSSETKSKQEDKVVITPETTDVKNIPTSETTTAVPREQRQADAETTTINTESKQESSTLTSTTLFPSTGSTPNFTALFIQLNQHTTGKPKSEDNPSSAASVPEVKAASPEKSDATTEASKESSSTSAESEQTSSKEMSKEEQATTIKQLESEATTKEDIKPKESATTESSSTPKTV